VIRHYWNENSQIKIAVETPGEVEIALVEKVGKAVRGIPLEIPGMRPRVVKMEL